MTGQRACTSGMMIEIALRLGLESLLETPAFQEYARIDCNQQLQL